MGDGSSAWNDLIYQLRSAYEVALANGFSGTEEEWLQSLSGSQGEGGPEGPQGIQGVEGSAYTNVSESSSSLIVPTAQDLGSLKLLTSSSDITVLIGTSISPISQGNASLGRSFSFVQLSSGKITVTAEDPNAVTILSATTTSSRSQNSIISVIQIAENTWLVVGDLEVF